MTKEEVIMAVTYCSPNYTTYARARGVIPDLSRANTRDEVAAVLIEHLVHESEHRRYWKAKATALTAELDKIKGTALTDDMRAYYPKPVLHADRRGVWHRDDIGANKE